MILQDFINRVNYALRGVDDEAPTLGSDEWIYWVDTLNRKKDELYLDTTKNWATTYQVANLGAVQASTTPTYELEDEFINPANMAYILTSTGARREYKIIKPEESTTNTQAVYIAGTDPQTLYFSQAIVTGDDIINGTLYLPGYYMPEDVLPTNANALIPLPDANWGVMAVAAELAFGDITYEDKTENLNAKANGLYNQMVMRNRKGTYGNTRQSPTYVNRIPDTRRSD